MTLLAPEGAGDRFTGFLSLLADNGRLGVLPEISGMYEDLRVEDERVVLAKVTSAAELPEAEVEQIRNALKRRFGREVQVETGLVGGTLVLRRLQALRA